MESRSGGSSAMESCDVSLLFIGGTEGPGGGSHSWL